MDSETRPISLRNLSLRERERLIEAGEIWIDEAGEIRPLNLASYVPSLRFATSGEPPDMVKVGEAVRNSSIRELALAHGRAALAHGKAIRALEAAERAEREALIRYERAALAAWSRKNARPHDDENDARIVRYFEKREEK